MMVVEIEVIDGPNDEVVYNVRVWVGWRGKEEILKEKKKKMETVADFEV